MDTLHILRSEPDEATRELILTVDPGADQPVALYEEPVDYDRLIAEIFSHDRVVSWW